MKSVMRRREDVDRNYYCKLNIVARKTTFDTMYFESDVLKYLQTHLEVTMDTFL